MKKLKDFITSIPIWLKILVYSIMFFVCIFIAVLTESPVLFLAYFLILNSFFCKILLFKVKRIYEYNNSWQTYNRQSS